MLMLIVGKSASGKDRLAQELEGKGLTQVISRTDRPKRNQDEATHVFVDTKTAEAESKNAVAATTIAGHTYYALEDDMEGKDVYIVDPQGVRDLCKNMPESVFHVIYVQADEAKRMSKAIARADDPKLAEETFKARDAAEAPDFEEFRLLCTDQPECLPDNVVTVTVIDNDYTPSTLANVAERLIRWKRQMDAVIHMMCEMSRYGIFDIDDNCHLKVHIDDQDQYWPLERAAATVLADDEQLSQLWRSYAGHA